MSLAMEMQRPTHMYTQPHKQPLSTFLILIYAYRIYAM